MSNKAHVKKYLSDYMAKNPQSALSRWYVGIAENAKDRLSGHNVSEKNGTWAFSAADTSAIAREVEQEFIDQGLDGGGGGGDATTKAVYVYVKTGNTNP
jgi:hypothetical protein